MFTEQSKNIEAFIKELYDHTEITESAKSEKIWDELYATVDVTCNDHDDVLSQIIVYKDACERDAFRAGFKQGVLFAASL